MNYMGQDLGMYIGDQKFEYAKGIHTYTIAQLENGKKDQTKYTRRSSEAFQIPTSSMWRLWGGIKLKQFPAPPAS